MGSRAPRVRNAVARNGDQTASGPESLATPPAPVWIVRQPFETVPHFAPLWVGPRDGAGPSGGKAAAAEQAAELVPAK